jgi:hypothetical protein
LISFVFAALYSCPSGQCVLAVWNGLDLGVFSVR